MEPNRTIENVLEAKARRTRANSLNQLHGNFLSRPVVQSFALCALQQRKAVPPHTYERSAWLAIAPNHGWRLLSR